MVVGGDVSLVVVSDCGDVVVGGVWWWAVVVGGGDVW